MRTEGGWKHVFVAVAVWGGYVALMVVKRIRGITGRRFALGAVALFRPFTGGFRFCLMELVCLGLNHKTAPVEVRERFAVGNTKLGEASKNLLEMSGAPEGGRRFHLQPDGILSRRRERSGRNYQAGAQSCGKSSWSRGAILPAGENGRRQAPVPCGQRT